MKLVKNHKQMDFDASMLDIGEIMEIDDEGYLNYYGQIILRTYDGFVSLTSPDNVWDLDCILKGRKLREGESVTLIQE